MESASRYRLAWIVCLLLLLGFIGNSVGNYLVSRHNVRKTITESSLPLTSDNIYSVIQRDLLRPIFISAMMSNDAFLRQWALEGEQDVSQIERYLSEIVNEFGTVTSFFVSEQTRNYYYAGGLLKQVYEDEPRDEWYFRVRQMREPFEINVDPDMANKDAMTIFINYRVYDFDGNYIGATGTGLTVSRVNELIEEYEERFGRQIYFCNRDGRIILSPRNSELQNYHSIREIDGLGDHVDAILAGNKERLVYERRGDTYFLNTRYVPELEWFLMVEQTEDELLAPLRENLYLNLATALGVTVVVALVCISAIHRNQGRLEQRNHELAAMNEEIQRQQALLRKSADELAEANASLSVISREKDDFLGIVAHDLRNPINGILGLCEEVRLELPPEQEDLQRMLAMIRKSGSEMLGLISDLLNVSFIESFHGELELEPANWNHLAAAACDRLRLQAEAKGIVLKHRLSEAADRQVHTRPNWLDICLNNLINNAIKFSPGDTEVCVETDYADGCFELRVRDQGPGLSPGEIEQLFHKFVRVSPRPTGDEPSTGLGLYIVRKMCERLGATVSVESRIDRGSCFIIRYAEQ